MELIIYIKMYLALNNLQRLICHKTKPNQSKVHFHTEWYFMWVLSVGQIDLFENDEY